MVVALQLLIKMLTFYALFCMYISQQDKYIVKGAMKKCNGFSEQINNKY